MSEKKQVFLLGTVLGAFVGVFLFVLVYLIYYIGDNNLNIESNRIAYNVNIDSTVNQAVKKASPNVVGVVRYRQDKENGTGSGVIYKLTKDKAYIITNQHVIKDAQKIEVAFIDENRVEAKLIGEDIITDLAIISIPRGELKSNIEFADSDELQVGEFVLAIGNPLGLNFYGSATLGIVSSTERLVPIDMDKDGESDWFANVIQTDAAINPGNSGGALINIDGKLIGINSMKIASSQVEGIGFSIPTNIVLQVINDIEKYGEVLRPFVGIQPISISQLTKDNKESLAVDYLTKGIYVNDVVPNSSAFRSGIKVNDIITKIDDEEIKNVTDFRYKVYQKDIGDNIKLSIIRENNAIEIDLVLQANIS